MDRVQELERVLESILELFEDDQVECNNGDLVFISMPLSEALVDAEDVLYGVGGEDDGTGTY